MASTPYQTSVAAGSMPDCYEVTIPVYACTAIADGDELIDWIPGHNFEILGLQFVCVTAISTGAKTTTIKPYIDGTVVPGTATAVAGTKAKGVVSTAFVSDPTSHLFGKATSKVKLTCSSTTSFTEGAGYWVIQMRNIGNIA